MRKKIDRTGEENYNNFGSLMIIKEHRAYDDMDIYFPDYDWIFEHAMYYNFTEGNIKCPYEPRLYNIGYIGEGKYKTKEKNKHTSAYITWSNMLQRCYNQKYINKNPAYMGCSVCEEWHNFQNFAKWYEENYYEVPDETMCLDKDILIKSNKIYSPDTCCFVPNRINVLFTNNKNYRGDLPIGVNSYGKNKFSYKLNKMNSNISINKFNTPEEAFYAYKEAKELYIKEVADEYIDYIPLNLYEAMYNWTIDIND